MTNLEFTEALLHLTGEFSGNLDFSVKSSGMLSTKAVLKNLRVRMPGMGQLVDVAGHMTTPSGVDVTVYSELMPPGKDIPADRVPESVEIFWLEQGKDEPVGNLPIRTEKG
ncbi:MAG: hypothetical protein HZB85_00065 [Deltaproteobacteria bacterium]|nr:hypothetical protein [Deltaproteobacteria bacterium]